MELLRKFLAIERWNSLRDALKKTTTQEAKPKLGLGLILIALFLVFLPILLALSSLTSLEIKENTFFIIIGLLSIVSFAFRYKLKLKPEKIATENQTSFRAELSLTHTAVAFGCIPVVLVVICSPSLVSEHQEIIREAVKPVVLDSGILERFLRLGGIALFISTWAAITEEIIFRYMLVSVLRRMPLFSKQLTKDTVAVTASGFLFGIAHLATWGVPASIALGALGMGFSLAYLATNEKIWPVLVYHFAFDLISISAALLI